jgi:hypothetical protein
MSTGWIWAIVVAVVVLLWVRRIYRYKGALQFLWAASDAAGGPQHVTDEQAAITLMQCVTRYGRGATDNAVNCHASGIR